jgi:hypothetical protein
LIAPATLSLAALAVVATYEVSFVILNFMRQCSERTKSVAVCVFEYRIVLSGALALLQLNFQLHHP